MKIVYKTDVVPAIEEIITVYRSSGINRPIDNPERIKQMYANSNLIITAWVNDELVGIARALTDFCYCCYLSDLAVTREYQKQGIGKRLIAVTKETIGDSSMLLLLAAPQVTNYYPKLGFTMVDNGFILKRSQ